MTERLRESLSALMDDEADDLELGRVLRAMEAGDDEVRETWSRYQLVSAVMSGLPMTASEPAAPLAVELDEPDTGPAAVAAGSHRSHRGRNWTSFAAAATVTLAVVLGWQWQDAPVEAPGTASTATSSSRVMSDPRGILNAADGAASVQGVAAGRSGRNGVPVPLRQVPPGAGEQHGAGHQVDAYMLYHAELSALNARSGMMPFARYASFQGAAGSR